LITWAGAVRPKTAKKTTKKLQNYSPRLGTVIFEAFSLRKRNSMRYTTKQQFQKEKKIFSIVLMMTKLDNDNNSG